MPISKIIIIILLFILLFLKWCICYPLKAKPTLNLMPLHSEPETFSDTFSSSFSLIWVSPSLTLSFSPSCSLFSQSLSPLALFCGHVFVCVSVYTCECFSVVKDTGVTVVLLHPIHVTVLDPTGHAPSRPVQPSPQSTNLQRGSQ